MKASVLINNFNYAKYIKQCVQSVLNQSYQDFEIIFVDDGSTDDSLEVVSEIKDVRINILKKNNGGQLSAFNAAVIKATGSVLFFLDSDDMYDSHYLEEAINFYKSNLDCDFLYVGKRFFGAKEGVFSSGETRTDGYTYYSSLYKRKWYGSVTSAVSVKRDVLLKLFPLESIESDWVTRADDCLVWGSSLIGAKKYYLDKPLVMYRVHDSNNFHGKKFDASYCWKREISIARFFNLVAYKSGFGETPSLFLMEFFSKEKTANRFFYYFYILIKARLPVGSKLAILLKMILKKNMSFTNC
ncbi:glycosyltransferase family 2 protein [Pseudomonas sihuiensis]|uniref:Glycosyltransferase involved in cell wall bisynthesis n=1 Tax=Pseudomonas sihuiensis TaxID=1274359 RepID=A0A1H2LA41_9PSED|nr:glycosyltransferase family 2 protein [Pseudomonas sihuiensis]SDU77468.1 Glycosyltransferase involved in cell wall bisynthesis [Pseudomonas sihuiensis]